MRSPSFVGSLSILAVAALTACGGSDDDVLFAPGGAGASGVAGASATKGGSGGVGGDLSGAGTGGAELGGKGGTTGKGGTGGKGGKAGTGGSAGEGGDSGEGGASGSDGGGSGGTGGSSGKAGTGGSGDKGGAGGKSGAAGMGGSAGKGGAAGTASGAAGAAGTTSAGAGGTENGGAAGTASGSGGAAGACPSPPLGYFAKPLQTNLQLIVDESGSMGQQVCGKSCGDSCCPNETRDIIQHAERAAKAWLGMAPTEPPLGLGLSRLPSATGCAPPAAPVVPLGDFPGNRPALLAAIDNLNAQGASATGPGIEAASKYLETTLAARPAEGRAIVFVTDGTPANCGAAGDQLGLKAAAASFARGVPVHVLAIVPNAQGKDTPIPGDLANANALAKAGGTEQADLIDEGKEVGAQLLAGFVLARRAAFSCRYDPTPASGSFDVDTAKIALVPLGGGELDLEPVANAAACTNTGYYLEGKNVALCPAICAIARQQSKPELLVTPTTCSP